MKKLRHKLAIFFLWLAHKTEPDWVSEVAAVSGTTITLKSNNPWVQTGDAVIIKHAKKKN
jgi:hypothetical protein